MKMLSEMMHVYCLLMSWLLCWLMKHYMCWYTCD